MTKSTITRERIEQYANDPRMCNINDEIRELARMALAAMDSDPVAYTDERNLGYIDRGRETAYLWGKQNSESSDVALYRHAQPAPVVPEKCPAEIRDLISSHTDALFNDDDAQEIWNACRAAMLQELKTVQELKRSAGVTKMCRCCTPNSWRNPIAARRKTKDGFR